MERRQHCQAVNVTNGWPCARLSGATGYCDQHAGRLVNLKFQEMTKVQPKRLTSDASQASAWMSILKPKPAPAPKRIVLPNRAPAHIVQFRPSSSFLHVVPKYYGTSPIYGNVVVRGSPLYWNLLHSGITIARTDFNDWLYYAV
jgi:hypothetical protein